MKFPFEFLSLVKILLVIGDLHCYKVFQALSLFSSQFRCQVIIEGSRINVKFARPGFVQTLGVLRFFDRRPRGESPLRKSFRAVCSVISLPPCRPRFPLIREKEMWKNPSFISSNDNNF